MKTQTDDGHTDALSHWDSDIPKLDALDDASSNNFSSSPQPRDSIDSAGAHSSNGHWRDSTTIYSDRRDALNTVQSVQGDPPILVEPSFDEGVLRALCELDVCSSFPNSEPAIHSLVFFYTVWCPASARSNQAKHYLVQGTPYVLPSPGD